MAARRAVGDRQRQVQDLAAADVERRVQALAALADLLVRASAATRTETITAKLADLNAIHADLLAGLGETAADVDFAERMAGDAATVIEQAHRAVERASEAALTLDLPDGASDETAGSPRSLPPPDSGRPQSTP